MVSVVAILAVLGGEVWLAQGRRGGPRAPDPVEEVPPAEPAAPPAEPAEAPPGREPPPGKVPSGEAPAEETPAGAPGGKGAPEDVRPPVAEVPGDVSPGEKGEEAPPPEAPREARSQARETGEARTRAEPPPATGAPASGSTDKGAAPVAAGSGDPDPAKGGEAPGKEAAAVPQDAPQEEGATAGAAEGPEAEPEAPGRFLTAAEVRPILDATRASWVAVRRWEGEDLLYFTHLESWRCGLAEIAYSVNGEELDVWRTDPCFVESATPNAIGADRLPYTVFPLGSIETVLVRITYDDGVIDEQAYARSQIAID